MTTAAIIGISNYARQHLLILAEQMLQQKVRIVAATVVNQGEEAFFCRRLSALGCELFDRTDQMWERYRGKIDVCFIPTGIHLHAAMTLEALRAGANVLVEKPLAASTEQARQIMRCEEETGRFVAVGFQDLYTPSTWEIKDALLAGELGRVDSISFSGLWPRPAEYYTRNDWAGRLQRDGQLVGDSPVSNAFAHFLNLALFWAGETREAAARVQEIACELYRTQAIESFDTCCARATLSSGCQLRFYVTHSCPEERSPRLLVQGTAGLLVWDYEKSYEISRADGTRERRPILGKFETKITMADAVIARVQGRAAPLCTTAIAFEHLRLIETLHAAAPIVDVAPVHLMRAKNAAGEWTELNGIDRATEEASRHGRLWSEIGVPWAVGMSATRAAS